MTKLKLFLPFNSRAFLNYLCFCIVFSSFLSCSNETASDNSNIEVDSLPQSQGLPTDTSATVLAPYSDTSSLLTDKWKKLKFKKNKFSQLISAAGFDKIKFIAVQSGSSDVIMLYTCAVNSNEQPIGNCILLKEGDQEDNPSSRPTDLPGWVLTKQQVQAFFGNQPPSKDLFLVPIMQSSSKEQNGMGHVDNFATYQIYQGDDATDLFLNPSPPGFNGVEMKSKR
jgi:hypothetical protein